MLRYWEWHWHSADRAEVPLWSLLSLIVQLLVLQLRYTFLACLLVLLAVGLLAVDTAVFDEAAGRAVLELDGVAPVLAAVGAGVAAIALARHATHVKCVEEGVGVDLGLRKLVVEGTGG